MDGEGQEVESAGGESCVLGGGGSGRAEGDGEYGRQQEEEELVYPWVGLLGRLGGAVGEAAVRAAFSEFNPKRVVVFEGDGREAGSAVAALLFDKSLEGYQDGFAFERCFLDKGRHRKAWGRAAGRGAGGAGEEGSRSGSFYGWLAGREDFYRGDEVGNFLFQHGELKSVAMVAEEQLAKYERRLEFLSVASAKKQESMAQEVEKLRALEADLERKNEELRGLRADSARQVLQATQSLEVELERARSELERRDAELEGSRLELERRDAELGAVRAELGALAAFGHGVLGGEKREDEVGAELEKRTAEIEDSERRIQGLLAAQVLQAELEKRNEELGAVRAELGRREEEMRAVSARHVLQATQALEAELEKRNVQMGAVRGELDRTCAELGAVKAGMEKRGEELRALRADSARQVLQATQALEAELEKRNAQVGALEAELEKRNDQVGALEAELEKRNGQVGALEADLASQVLETGRFKEATEALEAELGRRNGKLRLLQAEVGGLKVMWGSLKEDFVGEVLRATEAARADWERKSEELVALVAGHGVRARQGTQAGQETHSLDAEGGRSLEAELQASQSSEAEMQKGNVEMAALRAESSIQSMRKVQSLEAELEKKTRELFALKAEYARQIVKATQESQKEAEQLRQELKKRDVEAGAGTHPSSDGGAEAVKALSERADLVWAIEALKESVEKMREEKESLSLQLEEALKVRAEQQVQLEKMSAELDCKIEEVQDTARASVKQSFEFALIQSNHGKQLRALGERLADKTRALESMTRQKQDLHDRMGQQSEAESSTVQGLYLEVMVWAKELADRGNVIRSLHESLAAKHQEAVALRADKERSRKDFSRSILKSVEVSPPKADNLVLPPKQENRRPERARQKTVAQAGPIVSNTRQSERRKSGSRPSRSARKSQSKDRNHHWEDDDDDGDEDDEDDHRAKKARRSVSIAGLPLTLQWNVGELVFLESEDVHKWPAVVQQRGDNEPQQPGKVPVRMCGSEETIVVDEELLGKFTANDRLLLPNAVQSDPKFKVAVDQACALWDQQQEQIRSRRNQTLAAKRNQSPAKPRG